MSQTHDLMDQDARVTECFSPWKLWINLSHLLLLEEQQIALLTESLKSFITCEGFADFTTAVPDTIMLAPAF